MDAFSLEELREAARGDPRQKAADEALWSRVATELYRLDPDFVQLNYGYYHPAMTPVLDVELEALRRGNAQGSYYKGTRSETLREEARQAVAATAGVDAEETALVRNSSEAINTVVRGLRLRPGDEIESLRRSTIRRSSMSCRSEGARTASWSDASRSPKTLTARSRPMHVRGPVHRQDASDRGHPRHPRDRAVSSRPSMCAAGRVRAASRYSSTRRIRSLSSTRRRWHARPTSSAPVCTSGWELRWETRTAYPRPPAPPARSRSLVRRGGTPGGRYP